MPKINRVRIVNFSYNNNKRHIIDETFDFYGGENALLSLVNGGGKSVLVQAMLQPLLPKVTMLRRRFKGFFVSKATPSYIMLEWKLDDEAGYLLTGIAVTSRASHFATEDDEGFDIRYFTFINAYSRGNAFDIKNIPVAEQSGASVNIAKYQEFRKLLQKEAAKNDSGISVFDSGREDQSRYTDRLSSYNISKDEWKELILGINEAENGVSEVFSECKTSKKVMEQWIIKYIEKVLNKSSDTAVTDHKKLEIMMGQVARALVDNEKFLRDYKTIEEFKGRLNVLNDGVKTVLSELDMEEGLKKEIFGGYGVLSNEERKLTEEQQDTETSLLKLESSLGDIDREEKSLEAYKCDDRLIEVENALKEAAEAVIGHEAKLGEADAGRRLQKAAQIYGRIRIKTGEIAGLRQRLENASRDQEELLKEINNIKGLLKFAYGDQIEILEKDIESVEYDLKKAGEESNVLEDGIASGRKKVNELNVELGGTEKDIVNFELKEKKTLEELGIRLGRNPLLGEIDKGELEDAKSVLANELAAAELRLAENKEEAEELKEAYDRLMLKERELGNENIRLRVEEADIAKRIEDFNQAKEKAVAALKRFNIDGECIYDRSFILSEGKSYLRGWENKAYDYKMEISGLERQINGVENGVSYLPTALVALLKEHNLQCYTGEKYLREIGDEDRKRILEKNPLLPFALLATEKEGEILGDLIREREAEFGQIIPVIRHNYRDNPLELAGEGVQFITSSKSITLDSGDLQAYVEWLVEEKEKLIVGLEKANEAIERNNHDYQILQAFNFTREQAQALMEEEDRNKLRLADINEAIRNNEAEINVIEEKQGENLKQEEVSRGDISAAEVKIDRFNEYIGDNLRYEENVRRRSRIQSEIKSMEMEERKYQSAIEDLRAREKQLLNKRDSLARRCGETEARLAKVADAGDAIDMGEAAKASSVPEVPPVDEIPSLEGRLEACQSKQNDEAADLRVRIDNLNKDIKDFKEDIEKLKPETEDYKRMEYSKSREDELETLCGRITEELQSFNKEKNKRERDQSEWNARKAVAVKALGDKPILPKGEIKGDFDGRRAAIYSDRRKRQENINRISGEKLDILKLKTRIETEIKEGIDPHIGACSGDYTGIKVRIGQLLDEYVERKKNVDDSIKSFETIGAQFMASYSNSDESAVKEAVRGLQSQLVIIDRSYDKYFYLTERMDYYFLQLSNILKIMESKMQQLEHSRRDLTEHAFVEACRIYREIPKISENSAVEIDGVRRKVLEIDYAKMEDELEARGKMDAYIEDCLDTLTKLIKSSEDENRLGREIEKFMSTKELLNILSSLERCKIKAYKVDLNEKNRGMMEWEDIIVKNSGGEKFVAYFSLLVALISYSRKQVRGYEEFGRREDSKVLIMDNPFGPITSGHLLKPMFDIAQKYNTQLICLSDIKQGSVLGSFDLIYMIKIRQNMMQEDFIELEPIFQKEMKQDEKLETANLYSKVEQISLFEE